MRRLCCLMMLLAVASIGIRAYAMPIGIRIAIMGKTAASERIAETTVRVSFDASGGSVDPDSRDCVSGAAIAAMPTPTRDGYAFAGWFTAAEGGKVVTAETVVTADVTYYAHWTEIVEPEPTPMPEPDPEPTPEPTPTPTPVPVAPRYEVLEADDIAPYAVPKAMTLHGAAYDGCEVVGIVELKLGKVNVKKETSKISGSFTGLDGKKITLKAVTATGVDGTASVSVSFDVKGHGKMEVTIGGDRFTGTLGDRLHVQSADVGGKWTRTDAGVHVAATGDLPEGTIEELLPDGEPVIPKGGKWSFSKNATVKWARDRETKEYGLVVDTSRDKTNRSSMKLMYTPKKGTFKGSFKLYALEGADGKKKLKKYTVNVIGFVVDGKGTGEATRKKPKLGPWAVTVE